MKAPEKIYVEVRHPFGNEFTQMLGFEHRGNSDDIEYIRKDAFIEKACEWLEREYAYNGSMSVLNNELIEAFRKAMEN